MKSISTLKDLTVVFTGFRDKALENVIILNGGTVEKNVSKKTSVLITDDLEGESTKITTAKKLNIPIVTVEIFNKQLSKLMSFHTIKKISKKKFHDKGKKVTITLKKKNSEKDNIIEKKGSIIKIYADNIDKNGKIRKSKNIQEGYCLPFKYKGKLIDEKCIEGKEGNWCATTIDENQKMKTWGYC